MSQVNKYGIDWVASYKHDLVNPDSINRLQWILENCKGRVLDVGVGYGIIGDAISKNHDYLGFECSKLMQLFIKNYYPKLNIARLNYFDTKIDYSKYYNTILLGEILEHLENPAKLWGKATKFDRILITLPLQKYKNCIDHVWDIQAHIIDDQFGVPTHLCIRMDKKDRLCEADFWDG